MRGAAQTILAGGSEDLSQVYGNEYVSSGGKATSDTIHGGGDVYVLSGRIESASVISSGGAAVILSGGVFSSGKVAGGVLTVSSGGFVSGGLTISRGGTANISGSVAAGQDVVFSGAGDLALSNLANFHALIGGASTGDEFDLGGFANSPTESVKYTEAANLLSGTLSIQDGPLMANLTLLGNYVTSDFALSADGHGGALVKFV